MVPVRRLMILAATLAAVAFPAPGPAHAAHDPSRTVDRHAAAVQKIVDQSTRNINHAADNTVHVIQTLDDASVSDAVIRMMAGRGLTRVRRFADQGLPRIDRQTRIALWSVPRRGGTDPHEAAIISAGENARMRIEAAAAQAEARINDALNQATR